MMETETMPDSVKFKSRRKRRMIAVSLASAAVLLLADIAVLRWVRPAPEPLPTDQVRQLPAMRETDLRAFDGSDGAKPIYIGFEGLVYDVTAGANYYRPGGVYHFLAGKDSTADLRIAGGGIIKRKYPVVGRLEQ